MKKLRYADSHGCFEAIRGQVVSTQPISRAWDQRCHVLQMAPQIRRYGYVNDCTIKELGEDNRRLKCMDAEERMTA